MPGKLVPLKPPDLYACHRLWESNVMCTLSLVKRKLGPYFCISIRMYWYSFFSIFITGGSSSKTAQSWASCHGLEEARPYG